MRPVDSAEERLSVATQRQLVWWRFKRHRLALISLVVVLLFYLVALFAEFLAISDPRDGRAARALVPPQRVHLFDEGAFRFFDPSNLRYQAPV